MPVHVQHAHSQRVQVSGELAAGVAAQLERGGDQGPRVGVVRRHAHGHVGCWRVEEAARHQRLVQLPRAVSVQSRVHDDRVHPVEPHAAQRAERSGRVVRGEVVEGLRIGRQLRVVKRAALQERPSRVEALTRVSRVGLVGRLENVSRRSVSWTTSERDGASEGVVAKRLQTLPRNTGARRLALCFLTHPFSPRKRMIYVT